MLHNKIRSVKNMSLDDMRAQLEERRAKKKARRMKDRAKPIKLDTQERRKLLTKITEEYMKAPHDKRPTPYQLAKKYPEITLHTIRAWFQERGFKTNQRSVSRG